MAGALNGAKVILFTNAVTLTKLTTLADLTQPTYTGYAAVAITWGVAVRDAAGDIVTLSQAIPVQMGAPTDPDTKIKGYAVENSGATELLFAEVFPQQLDLVDDLTYYEIVVPFAPGKPQGKTAIVVS